MHNNDSDRKKAVDRIRRLIAKSRRMRVVDGKQLDLVEYMIEKERRDGTSCCDSNVDGKRK